tara:strand:+ start:2351 stop:2689 length:339 start_codon:yes stop_codon:yes gene_type:complete
MISQSKLQKTLNRLTGPTHHGNLVREQLSRSAPVHVTYHLEEETVNLPITIENGQAYLRYKEIVATAHFVPFDDIDRDYLSAFELNDDGSFREPEKSIEDAYFSRFKSAGNT